MILVLYLVDLFCLFLKDSFVHVEAQRSSLIYQENLFALTLYPGLLTMTNLLYLTQLLLYYLL